MGIPGFATAIGTRRYRDRFEGRDIAQGHFRETSEGLCLSSLGMGTYLGNPDDVTSQQMRDAAVTSLISGAVNVLDSAINYRHQLSERALAQALKQAIDAGQVQRDELLICSKNGFLAPDAQHHSAAESFRNWFTQRYIQTGRVQHDDIVGGMHCMAPGYLDDQLNLSRTNLGVETIDVMYLHNAAESQIPVIGRDRFMQRLQQAFEFYEQARQDGRIQYYGLATWSCFRVEPEESGDYLSLETVIQLAEEVGGVNHGCRFIQLPFNLAFTEALTLNNQPLEGEMLCLLEAAMGLNLNVFTSVPLLQGQLLKESRLPRFDGVQTPAQRCLQFVRSTPGILAPLVGHKQPAHVQENLAVAQTPPQAFSTNAPNEPPY